MVRKQQIIKQSVNVKVHVGDSKKKKNGRRRKKGSGGGGGGGGGLPQPIHAFSPVYIQSGNPPPDPNPLLKAIQDIHTKVENHHMEYLHNELRHRVRNVDRGNIAIPVKEQDTQTNNENHMETQTHKMDIHRDTQTSPDTIEHISNPLKSTYSTATQMMERYPPRSPSQRQAMTSPPPRNLINEMRTPSVRKEKGVDFEDIYPVRNSSNVIEDDSQAGGGGTGTTRGTRQEPTCSACGLKGHRKNSKKCPRHAFHEA